MQPGPSPTAATLETSNAVYAVDFKRRSTRQIFTTGPERILGASDLLSPNAEWLYTVLATDRSVIVLDREGKVVLKQAFRTARRYNYEVRVSSLEPAGQFALWVPQDPGTNWPGGGTPPTLVTWFGRDQGVIRSTELAALPPVRESFNLREHVLSAALPPVALLAMPLVTDQVRSWRIPKEMLRTSLIAALICIPAVWWLGWRYRFSLGTRAVWSGFILLTGIPGLLAFLCAQEWPARVPCHQCGKLRVVDREHCEHCGAEFSPPEKVGTEIFEPLPTAQG
jgi:hypothetical protein